MAFLCILFNRVTLYCSFVALVTAIIVSRYEYATLMDFFLKPHAHNTKENLFTPSELSKYNGVEQSDLYLAILGSVFDVTKGRKHYEKGASYHFFVGKDASKSFVSGDFKDETAGKDDVLDLPCADLFGLTSWLDTYSKQYSYKGKLVGRYYNEDGENTQYKISLNNKLKMCELEKKSQDNLRLEYPPCNIEWSAADGTRVWCTKNSGGVSRDWMGSPHQLFTPGDSTPQCVCVDLSKDNSQALLKKYDNCQEASVSCYLSN